MRVIKVGHIKEQEVFCNHCGSEIGYFPGDIIHKQVSKYYCSLLKCPICGKTIVLEKIERYS